MEMLAKTLFTLNFLNDENDSTAVDRHFHKSHLETRSRSPAVWWKDVQSNQWFPGTSITWGKGYACVMPDDAIKPVRVPSH